MMKISFKNVKNLLFLCIFLFSCIFISYFAFKEVETIQSQYNYDSIYEVFGTISKISVSNNKFYITVECSNDIFLEKSCGDILENAVGDEVTVYTDGEYYCFSAEEVMEENTGVGNFIVIVFFSGMGACICIAILLCKMVILFLCFLDKIFSRTVKANI